MTSVPAASTVPADEAPATQLPVDLVPVITRHLEEVGEYRVVVDPRQAQQLVDLRWAALGAGRALGRKVHVITHRAIETREAPIAVVVRFDEQYRRAIPEQRQR